MTRLGLLAVIVVSGCAAKPDPLTGSWTMAQGSTCHRNLRIDKESRSFEHEIVCPQGSGTLLAEIHAGEIAIPGPDQLRFLRKTTTCTDGSPPIMGTVGYRVEGDQLTITAANAALVLRREAPGDGYSGVTILRGCQPTVAPGGAPITFLLGGALFD